MTNHVLTKKARKSAPHLNPVAHIISALITFLRENTVFCIALAAAAVTSVLVPPDAEDIS